MGLPVWKKLKPWWFQILQFWDPLERLYVITSGTPGEKAMLTSLVYAFRTDTPLRISSNWLTGTRNPPPHSPLDALAHPQIWDPSETGISAHAMLCTQTSLGWL